MWWTGASATLVWLSPMGGLKSSHLTLEALKLLREFLSFSLSCSLLGSLVVSVCNPGGRKPRGSLKNML